MRIVLMGMPGVGKGTQAARLVGDIGAVHVSTGDILRDAVQGGSALGRKVRGFLDSGALVPDDVMEDLIVERLGRSDAAAGFILDGFPRTLPQVQTLESILERLGVRLDVVFLLAAPQSEIVRRLTGRRVCPSCGSLFHLEQRPPSSAGVCDECGSALVQRPDDTESVIRERLRVFDEQTLPIADAYRERGLLREIDGTGTPQDVFGRLRQELQAT